MSSNHQAIDLKEICKQQIFNNLNKVVPNTFIQKKIKKSVINTPLHNSQYCDKNETDKLFYQIVSKYNKNHLFFDNNAFLTDSSSPCFDESNKEQINNKYNTEDNFENPSKKIRYSENQSHNFGTSATTLNFNDDVITSALTNNNLKNCDDMSNWDFEQIDCKLIYQYIDELYIENDVPIIINM